MEMATNEKNEKLSKPTSVIVQLTEWFAALAMTNLMWIVCSIPLITLLPATETLFFMVNHIYHKKEKFSAKLFFSHFKSNFKASYKKNWPILLVAVIFGLDYSVIHNQAELPAMINILSIAIGILFFLMFLGTIIYFSVCVRIKESTRKQWILAFYIVLRFPFNTLMVVVLITVMILLFLIWPAFSLFFSISLPALMSTIAVDKALEKLNN